MPTTEQQDRPLKTGDVAAIFNVSPQTVINWTEAKLLPFFRTPRGHRRFRREDVEAFLAAGQKEAS